MTSITASATDLQVRSAVESELEWTPGVDAAGIGVAVEEGAVTLSGEVDSFWEKSAAARAALQVTGVTTVTNDLTIRPDSGLWAVSATELGRNVESAIAWLASEPNTVRAEIAGHRVILSGQVQWNYQRIQARLAVERVPGVSEVENRIALSPRPSASDTAQRITSALVRNAAVEAGSISVEASGHAVTLTGTVRSYAERMIAEDAAWSSPHVMSVDNRLRIRAF